MEAVQTPASPVAEPSDAVSAASGQSAPVESPPPLVLSDDEFDSFLRDHIAAGSRRVTLNPEGVVPTAELEAAASGESAPEQGDVSPGAVPPEDAGEPARTAGRRSAAAQRDLSTIEGLRAHIADLEASIPDRVADATRQADEARAEAARLREQQDTASKQVYELIGTPEEYAQLLEIPDDEISNEDYTKKLVWQKNRRIYRPLETQYRDEAKAGADAFVNGVRQQWGARVLQVADKRGLDRSFIADPKNHDLDTLLEHAVARTEARVRAEYEERLSQAERDRDAARGEAVSTRRTPVTNGQASGAGLAEDDEAWLRRLAGYGSR